MLDIINTELNTISPVLRLVSLNCKFNLSSFITSRSTGEKVAQTAIGEDRRLFFVIVTLDSTAAGRRAAGQGGRVSKVKIFCSGIGEKLKRGRGIVKRGLVSGSERR